ncbi:PAS domain S-box-containing protein [Pseudomonas nitritireducens]|uniref:PAS domain S-box-containing protein n=1 Tax=Pseudomonas nitroreducens TaxID=46680 RepID=A0A7W7KJX3_PSENT|nr:response regulator [Pseudomonas nitritireducens]MBB4864104.1 PAS domain S-box-containing protein [Pseudomonas nitritireducens]
MARVLLADATPIVRDALRTLLEDMRHEVVAEAVDVPTALSLARETRPELVILELSLPGAGGLDLLRRLRAREARQKVLVYTRQNPAHFAPLCFQAGAAGFVGKDQDTALLRKAIADVLAGRGHFAREYMQPGAGDALASLTPRELAVLQLIAEGHSNVRIAEQLRINFKTVSTYKAHLLEKLHVGSNVELAEIARRNGLVAGYPGGAAVSEALPAELGLLRDLVDAAPNPMFVRNIEGRLLFCNQRFLDYHHTSAEVALSASLADSPWLPAEYRESLPQRFEQMIHDGVPVQGVRRMVVQGQVRVVHIWMVPCRDSSGQPSGVLGGLQDVTDSEEQLIEWRDRALAAEGRLHRSREIGTAALEELSARLAALELHPATPGLAGFSQALEQFKSTCDPRQDTPMPALEPCDPLLLIQAVLANHPGSRLDNRCIQPLRGWLDAGLLRAWMNAALGLLVAGPDGALTVMLDAKATRQGQVLMRLELNGPGGQPSIVLQQYALRVAERLSARMGIERGSERVTIDLELEFALAAGP